MKLSTKKILSNYKSSIYIFFVYLRLIKETIKIYE